jgi:hypothetical protein
MLLEGCPANGAARKFLLFDLQKALFAESVTAVQISGYSSITIEIFYA